MGKTAFNVSGSDLEAILAEKKVHTSLLHYVNLYHPPDVELAYTVWQASCGPGALAALLGKPVDSIRRLFPEFPRKPYANPSTMWTAIALAGRQAKKTDIAWPLYGLAFVQWMGPWLGPGVPVTAAYRHTHWIGVAHTCEYGRMVYDINAWTEPESHLGEVRGAWTPFNWWAQEMVPAITAEIPRATGDWHLRWTCHLFPEERPDVP